MIEQKAIFEAAQTAFEAHHPKFPFPKKNNLDEQTDQFKKAFLVFSTDINAMHDKVLSAMVINNREEKDVLLNRVQTWRDEAHTHNKKAEAAEAALFGAQSMAFIGWVAAIVLGIALIAFKLNS